MANLRWSIVKRKAPHASRLTPDAGFTTTELIVASLFALLVMATLYSFYRDQLYNLLSQETKTATLEDARGALDLMVRELRNAGSFPLTTDATCLKDDLGNPRRVLSATATSIQIQTDTTRPGGGDPDGKCTETGEDVTYAYVATTTSTCPAGRITRKGDCLVGNVPPPPAGTDFLTYYSAGSTTPLSHPISDYSTIRRVKITFAVQMQNPNPNARSASPNISTTLSSSVEFRN